jgi:3-oxoacyl-[acyl-carrier-protein] synthase-3
MREGCEGRAAARLGPRRRRRVERFLYSEVGGLIQMEGKEVFRRAVRIMVDSAEKSMRPPASRPTRSRSSCPTRRTSASSSRRCDRLGVRWSAPADHSHYTGNTSSGRSRSRLAAALDEGKVRDGDLVLLVGFGAGMTAASACCAGRPVTSEVSGRDPSQPPFWATSVAPPETQIARNSIAQQGVART